MALTWNATNGADNYTVYFSTDNSSFTAISPVVTGTSYTHTGLSTSTTYYYYIKANNTAGTSGESARASATTSAAPGISLSATTATVRESGVRGDMLWTRVPSNFPTAGGGHLLDRNVIDSEMNVISTGQTKRSIIATNAGYYDMMMMKHGPSGELIWQKQFGSNHNDEIVDVALDSNDNIYVFGYTQTANGGTFDGVTISKSAGSSTYSYLWLLIKYDKDGNRQWITQIDKTGSSSGYGQSRAMDIEGSSIYVAGYSAADSVNQVEKYDLNGVKQGSTINLTPPTDSSFISGNSGHLPWVNDLDATPNGVFVVVSRRGSNHLIRSELTKLDNNLTSEVWQVVHPGDYEYYAVKEMPNGNIVAHARETYDANGNVQAPENRLISIYNSSGSLVTSGAFNQGNTNRVNMVGSDNPSNLTVDSANNILMIQWDYADRYQGYLVKYNSSGNFVNEKKLPPNFMSKAIDIRQNSAGEEYIYLTGIDNSLHHSHSYGEIGYKYLPTYVGRISNNSVAPVSSTPGYASIKFELATEPTSTVWVCPRYSNAYITTGIVSDELAVHPAGPMTQTYPTNSNPFYHNDCLRLHPTPNSNNPTIFHNQPVEFYAIQDNVTDTDQTFPITFEVISNDSNYNGMSLPTVNVTVENAAVSAPTAPVNLKATASGANNLITWQKPIMTGLGEGVQSYTLQWNTDNGTSWTEITGITSDNYTHSGLSSSTNYFYQVFANNQGGAGAVSNRASATTPAAPGITLSATTATVRESGNRGDMLWTRVHSDFPSNTPTGTSTSHLLYKNTIDSEMNVISVGYTSRSIISPNQGRVDWIIIKHGPSGELIWQKQIGSSANDNIRDVAVDSNDNVYVFGSTAEVNGGTFDGETISKAGSNANDLVWILVKFDKDGNRQWFKQIDKTDSSATANAASAYPRAMDIEGNAIYVAGRSGVDNVNQVEKYDLDGNKQGSTINLTPPTHSDFTSHIPWVNDLDATPNGVFVTVSRTNGGIRRSKLTKLDNNLTSEVWQVDHPGD